MLPSIGQQMPKMNPVKLDDLHESDKTVLRRSISLEQLAPLINPAGATFYSLQMGPPAAQIKEVGSRLRIFDLQDE